MPFAIDTGRRTDQPRRTPHAKQKVSGQRNDLVQTRPGEDKHQGHSIGGENGTQSASSANNIGSRGVYVAAMQEATQRTPRTQSFFHSGQFSGSSGSDVGYSPSTRAQHCLGGGGGYGGDEDDVVRVLELGICVPQELRPGDATVGIRVGATARVENADSHRER